MNEKQFKHGTLELIQGDITMQQTEAIVNAANSSLMGGGGVDGAIHRAGGPAILEECKVIVAKIGRLPPGRAVITTAGAMPSKFVIHTVGPIWGGGDRNEPATLASCYIESLRIAKEKGIASVAFPSISTGAYGYPMDKAAEVAIKAVADFLDNNQGVKSVVFVLWGDEAFDMYSEALGKLKK
jgi:O-acetyl-ADP-ribose deacetylase (regulator of RNase III)